MTHRVSTADNDFKNQIECGVFPVAEFDHRAHLRLAYIYLLQARCTEQAIERIRAALFGLLKQADIAPSVKYHHTLTQAWVLAVQHFMCCTKSCASAQQFIQQNPQMLDSNIMLSHYSADLLFSDDARQRFIQPNLQAIPVHGR